MVKQAATNGFRLHNVMFPTIVFYMPIVSSDMEFNIAWRLDLEQVGPHRLKILLGIRLTRGTGNAADIACVVEVAGLFEVSQSIDSYRKASDLPLFANMVAFLLPYLRERISTCFAGVGVPFFLDPMSVHSFLGDDDFQNRPIARAGAVTTVKGKPERKRKRN